MARNFLQKCVEFTYLPSCLLRRSSTLAGVQESAKSLPASVTLPSWQKPVLPPREVWVESLKQDNLNQKEIMELNPTVFAGYPRIDLLYKNIQWQLLYRKMDDLHVVDNLDLDIDDPKAFEDLLDSRLWGPSVLFVDDTDLMPERISLVTEQIPHYNLMPVYGLNVYSMLKHSTLVLTVDAVRKIEDKIMYHLHRTDVPKV